jgi:anaerobic ribonucleoside-triphosphate reductase
MTIEDIKLNDSERTQCEVWSRVMGYHRPVSEFNRGKKEEFYERKCFTEEKAVEHLMLDNALAAE